MPFLHLEGQSPGGAELPLSQEGGREVRLVEQIDVIFGWLLQLFKAFLPLKYLH